MRDIDIDNQWLRVEYEAFARPRRGRIAAVIPFLGGASLELSGLYVMPNGKRKGKIVTLLIGCCANPEAERRRPNGRQEGFKLHCQGRLV